MRSVVQGPFYLLLTLYKKTSVGAALWTMLRYPGRNHAYHAKCGLKHDTWITDKKVPGHCAYVARRK